MKRWEWETVLLVQQPFSVPNVMQKREVSRQREGRAVEIVPPLVTGVQSSLSAVADDKRKRKKRSSRHWTICFCDRIKM